MLCHVTYNDMQGDPVQTHKIQMNSTRAKILAEKIPTLVKVELIYHPMYPPTLMILFSEDPQTTHLRAFATSCANIQHGIEIALQNLECSIWLI